MRRIKPQKVSSERIKIISTYPNNIYIIKMYAQAFCIKSKEDILKQVIQVKPAIRRYDTNRIIEEQTLADRKSKVFEPVFQQ